MHIDDYSDVTFYEQKLPLDELLKLAADCKDIKQQYDETCTFLVQDNFFRKLFELGSQLIRHELYGEGLKCFENALAVISDNPTNYFIPAGLSINMGDRVPLEFIVIINTLTAYYMKTENNKVKSLIQENIFIKRGTQIQANWGDFLYQQADRIQCAKLRENEAFKDLIGASREWHIILRQIEKYAVTSDSILIKGPSGVGKELIAKAIHKKSGRKIFKAINCAAETDDLAGSTLFGYVKGSFTGAIADRKGYCEEIGDGTLFLDEIDKTSKIFQAKLLRLLQERVYTRIGSTEEKKFNGRFIAAINRDIIKAIEQDNFFEDIYWRLCNFEIDIPPLSNRPMDLEELIIFFIKEAQKPVKISVEAFRAICNYFDHRYYNQELKAKIMDEVEDKESQKEAAKHWGVELGKILENNVRELKIVINRLVIEIDKENIAFSDLPRQYKSISHLPWIDFYRIPMEVAKEGYKNKELKKALALTENNQTKVAVLFGCSPQAINQRVKSL